MFSVNVSPAVTVAGPFNTNDDTALGSTLSVIVVSSAGWSDTVMTTPFAARVILTVWVITVSAVKYTVSGSMVCVVSRIGTVDVWNRALPQVSAAVMVKMKSEPAETAVGPVIR